MRPRLGLVVLLAFGMLPGAALAAGATRGEYAGAAACSGCHPDIFERWAETGHSRIMVRPRSAAAWDVPMPAGVSEDDVAWVIGGFRWKALFVDRRGYLLTADGGGPGRTQFNVASRRWADYRPGERVPYDCGPCHATGYSAEGHQDDLPGVVGTWSFDGVECEACHGPGAVHARTRERGAIRRGEESCARCHGTGPPEGVPLVGRLLAPYTEADQLALSPKRGMACTVCHDPHRSAAAGLRASCDQCHEGEARVYAGSLMARARVACVDCHMPPAGLVAEGSDALFRGDLRSHLFVVDHHEVAPERTVGGRAVNPGALGVGHACFRCHDVFESRQWALAYAPLVHRLQATTNARIMDLQAGFAYVGVALALLALATGAAARGWVPRLASPATLSALHRHAAGASLAIALFETTLCLYVHTPFAQPARLANLGWFVVHPALGTVVLLLYGGKVLAVRRLGLGWGSAGALLGASLFLFWALQVATIVLVRFEIVKM